MNFKAYALGGEVLLAGSATLTPSRRREPNNWPTVTRDAGAAYLDALLERALDAGRTMVEFEPAIKQGKTLNAFDCAEGRWSRSRSSIPPRGGST